MTEWKTAVAHENELDRLLEIAAAKVIEYCAGKSGDQGEAEVFDYVEKAFADRNDPLLSDQVTRIVTRAMIAQQRCFREHFQDKVRELETRASEARKAKAGKWQ